MCVTVTSHAIFCETVHEQIYASLSYSRFFVVQFAKLIDYSQPVRLKTTHDLAEVGDNSQIFFLPAFSARSTAVFRIRRLIKYPQHNFMIDYLGLPVKMTLRNAARMVTAGRAPLGFTSLCNVRTVRLHLCSHCYTLHDVFAHFLLLFECEITVVSLVHRHWHSALPLHAGKSPTCGPQFCFALCHDGYSRKGKFIGTEIEFLMSVQSSAPTISGSDAPAMWMLTASGLLYSQAKAIVKPLPYYCNRE